MTWEVSDVPWQVERECWCQGGWRRCWVQMWITKGPPHRSNPGITETPTVTSCKMGRCQDMLCFAKEWNWKLLLLGYFSFSQGKKSDCFILNECLRRQSRASISHSAEISDFSAPSPIAWGTRWKIFAPFQKKGLKITSHSAGEGPEHQTLSWMMRAGETEGGVPLLCLLAQQFHTLSAVKFSRTNTFAQKTLVLINCHFPATQIPIHWKHSGGTARTATGLGVLMSKGKINLGSGRINNQFSHAWGAKLKAFDVKKHLNNQMLIFIALENSILRVGTELGGAKRGHTYFFLWEDSGCTCQLILRTLLRREEGA